MSFTSGEDGRTARVGPKVYADVPSVGELAAVKRSRAQIMIILILLLGVQLALFVAFYALYSTPAGDAGPASVVQSVRQYSAYSLYDNAIEGVRTAFENLGFENLGIGFINLLFLSGYLALCFLLQSIFFGLRLFTKSDEGFVSELRSLAQAFVALGVLPAIFALSLIAAPVLLVRDRKQARGAILTASAPLLWPIVVFIIVTMLYAAFGGLNWIIGRVL